MQLQAKFLSVVVVVAVIVLGAWSAERASDYQLRNDTAQYLSVAINIARGDGASTDVLYYDSHFRSKSLPVPQTIWPPGFPYLIVLASKFGFSMTESVVFVAATAFFLTAAGIWILLGLSGAPRSYQFLASSIWLLFSPAWIDAVGGMSGGTAVCLSVFSAIAYMKSTVNHASSYASQCIFLALSGIAAGLSFTVHYSSAFYLIALAIVFLFGLVEYRWRWIWIRSALLGITTCGIVAAVVWRNYTLTGTITRRIDGETVASTTDAIFSILAALSSQFGIARDGHSLSVLSAMATIALGGVVLSAVIKAANKRKLFAGLGLPVLWLAIGILGYVLPVFFGGRVRMSPRYLSYLAPAALVVLLVIFHRAQARYENGGIHRRPVVVLVMLSIILMAHAKQLYYFRLNDDTYNNNLVISQLLDRKIADQTIKEYLSASTNRSSPIFANEPQSVFHVMRKPIIGVPPNQYGPTTWNDLAVRDLIRKFDVQYVVFLTAFMDTSTWFWSRHPFYEQLEKNVLPLWLQVVYADADIRVYRVTTS